MNYNSSTDQDLDYQLTNSPNPNPNPKPSNGVTFTTVNKCSYTVWVGTYGQSNKQPTFNYHGINYNCPLNGGYAACPQELTVTNSDGQVVACMSA